LRDLKTGEFEEELSRQVVAIFCNFDESGDDVKCGIEYGAANDGHEFSGVEFGGDRDGWRHGFALKFRYGFGVGLRHFDEVRGGGHGFS